MLSMVNSVSPCHGIRASRALPGTISYSSVSRSIERSLFMTSATPAALWLGPCERMILRCVPKRLCKSSTSSCLRCASWMASTLIFDSLIIWLMSLHLSVVPLSLYLPRIFRDAIVMFALVFLVFWFLCLVLYLVVRYGVHFGAGVAMLVWRGMPFGWCLPPLSPPRSSDTKPIAGA